MQFLQTGRLIFNKPIFTEKIREGSTSFFAPRFISERKQCRHRYQFQSGNKLGTITNYDQLIHIDPLFGVFSLI